eukprot:CAMPEP_0180157926 /NCGR_PEP_ID=MMETSP0986-20121125/26566_1 /TAXON_ID=697907 /ORGANISM="non described non described, Strain CCMP2293" /LENGTH=76 /DNA_ID=CAMNT_0022107607 /DNA_START=14 /DNA_END=244 /DNA_ORIENTATION=+
MFADIRSAHELITSLHMTELAMPDDFTLNDYQYTYENSRTAYLTAAEALQKATGPYKATRDAYVAAASTYTKSLYE